ncbi:hypothetical protein GCM10027038_27080 [Arthrobacter bambusae]
MLIVGTESPNVYAADEDPPVGVIRLQTSDEGLSPQVLGGIGEANQAGSQPPVPPDDRLQPLQNKQQDSFGTGHAWEGLPES